MAEKYGADVLDVFESNNGDPAAIGETISRLRGIVKRNLDEYGVTDVSQLTPQYDGDIASDTIRMSKRADKLDAAFRASGPVCGKHGNFTYGLLEAVKSQCRLGSTI